MNTNYKSRTSRSAPRLFSGWAIWLVALVSAQQIAAQSPMSVWQTGGPNADIRSITVDPFDPNVVYAGGRSGVFKSVNNGASWSLVSSMDVRDLAVDHVHPNTIFAGTGYGVFKSTNGGVNWTNLNAPFSAVWMQVSQSDPNLIATADGVNNVAFTSNGGLTWNARPFSGPFSILNAGSFATEFDPRDPNIIYTYVTDYDNIGLFRSTNGGVSWAEFDYGNIIAHTSAFEVNSQDPNRVYAATSLGFYRSADGGASWSLLGYPGEAEALVKDPIDAGSIYAGGAWIRNAGYNGVNKSADEGATWSAFNNGLTNWEVRDLAFDRLGRYLHAATPIGVFSVKIRENNIRGEFDFDGDGRSDISVFRPSDRTWYLNRSRSGFSATQFGVSTDQITPADFDGDGKTDIAVYRNGTWFWLGSINGSFGSVQFGAGGDVPVPADFSGDGRDELAVYRSGVWFTLDLADNSVQATQFGVASDKPVAADYDGDGAADHAVYRDGTWYLLQSTQGFAAIQFGVSTDRPVPADYDGDGKTDAAVYRDGTWYLSGSQIGFTAFQFGMASDVPAPADYDGDGKADTAVFRNGVWYMQGTTSGLGATHFGVANDKPIPSAYVP